MTQSMPCCFIVLLSANFCVSSGTQLYLVFDNTERREEVGWLVQGDLSSGLFAACVAAKWGSESRKTLQLLELFFQCD